MNAYNFYLIRANYLPSGKYLKDYPLASKLKAGERSKFVRALHDNFKFHQVLAHKDGRGYLMFKTFHTWWGLKLNKNNKVVDIFPWF